MKDYLKKVKLKVDVRHVAHRNYANVLSCRYNMLMYMGIICGPLSGFICNISQSLNHQDRPIYYIVASFIAYLSGIIIAIIKYGDFSELSLSHRNFALKYLSLSNNILRQLEVCSDQISDDEDYIKWIEHTYDNLLKESPWVTINTIEDTGVQTVNNVITNDLGNIQSNPKMQYELDRFQRNFEHRKNAQTNYVPRLVV